MHVSKTQHVRKVGCLAVLQFKIQDSEILTTIFKLPTRFSCFMFHWQRKQTMAAGSWFVLLSTGLIISSLTAQHTETHG